MTDPRFSIIPAAAVTEHDKWALEILGARATEAEPVLDEGYDTSAVMALAARFGGRCWYCGCELTEPVGAGTLSTTATRDHVVPRSRGGTNASDNLVPACRRCNNAKRAKTLEEYRQVVSASSGGAAVVFFGELPR